MLGLTKGAIFAISSVAASAAVGAIAYRAWQAAAPAPVIASAAPAPASGTPALPTGTADHQFGQIVPIVPQAPQAALPGFDVVRVEPTGDSVVAGRAAPNSEVALLDRGSVIATTKADADGQFALVPPPLSAGDHLLALGEKNGENQVISAETVTVAVPQTKGSGAAVVALTEPDQPTRLLSASPRPASAAGSPEMIIRTVETQQGGGFFATGSAPAGAAVRLYLNGSAVADLHAGPDGKWSLQITKGMQPGSYVVRADQLESTSGQVIARAEVPFDYNAAASAETGTSPDAAKEGAAIAAISTVTVTHGDNLWRISRKVLGRGIRYTQIYAANSAQIRNPRLIYPGQVLVRPQTSVN